jgi:RNA polymerase sigma-70 factor (ECF subfamily)
VTDDNVKPVEAALQTSSGLLERVQANDQEAWVRFVHLYSPLVYRWCRQAGLQEADAADVGQEVFRSVAPAIGQFHHDRPGDTFRGWLRTITMNKLRDFARRGSKQARGAGGSAALERLLELPADGSEDTDGSAAQEENLLVYHRAVELILGEHEERTRQAFLRVVIEGQTPSEVAEQLGITVNAVYLAKSRVLRRLREEFGELLVQ